MMRVGCAGWSIPRASAANFPNDGSHLQRYAGVLNAAEINSSFHRPHRRSTYEKWAASVGPDFRFSVKLPKQITHEYRLADATSLIDDFLDQIQGLADRLGCLLVQLPPSLALASDVASSFFSYFRSVFQGPIVLEARHSSWCTAEADSILADFRIGRVAADPPVIPCADKPGDGSQVKYFRLHGSPRVYYSAYQTEFLSELASVLVARLSQKHETWCICDNTAAGHAIENALQLQLKFNTASIGLAEPNPSPKKRARSTTTTNAAKPIRGKVAKTNGAKPSVSKRERAVPRRKKKS